MLNYEEFKEKVKDEITDHMSSKYKDCIVDIRETKKTNRKSTKKLYAHTE